MGVVIGVMARAPLPGRCKTRLSEALGACDAAALYRAMLLDTLASFTRVAVKRWVLLAAPEDDGVAVLRSIAPSPWEVTPQEGTDLGERLAHACRALGAGGDAVVLVDSDSPTVPIAPIASALARFHGPRRALIGPCEDGGYYLIGLTTVDGGELGVFASIPWSTSSVISQTRERCDALGLRCEELPTGYDVDGAADLAQLRAELRQHPERAPHTAAWLRDQ